jgi:hypothetical protein
MRRSIILAALVAAGLAAAPTTDAATKCKGTSGDPVIACSGGGPNDLNPVNTGGSGGRVVLSNPDADGGYNSQVISGGGGFRGVGDGAEPGDPIQHTGQGGRCTLLLGTDDSFCTGRYFSGRP